MMVRRMRYVEQPTSDAMDLEQGSWHYNPRLKRWEITSLGWRGIVARWANSSEWTAAIEPSGSGGAQRVAPHLFSWQDDAQAWCVAAIRAALQISDDAAQ
jgi:hypothetical protein